MSPGVRKFGLVVHICLSLGWLGALAAYIVLDLTAATTNDPRILRMAYQAMDLVVTRAIVPFAAGSLLTGVVMSLGTAWGLFRHWWVLTSFALTLFATLVLAIESATVRSMAAIAANPAATEAAIAGLDTTLLHSVGGAAVLVTIAVLNVFKPRGVTPYGWRVQQAERRQRPATSDATSSD